MWATFVRFLLLDHSILASQNWEMEPSRNESFAAGLPQGFGSNVIPRRCYCWQTTISAPDSKPYPHLKASHVYPATNYASSLCSNKVEHKDCLRCRMKFPRGL